jgi:glycolate oxidase iron-sulfur subunit
MNSIEATGAQYVASGCPGCQMQLTVGAKRRGLDLRIVHPIQLLDAAYRDGEG